MYKILNTNNMTSQQKPKKPEGSGMAYSKFWKKKSL